MATSISFLEFIKALPACNIKEDVPIYKKDLDFKYVTESLTEFVPPDLKINEDLSNLKGKKPKVAIISASGAVGKSTLAAEIAVQCKVPLWDLSLFGSVGAASLPGRLSQAYGHKASSIHEAISLSSAFLVIDALDEAQIKASYSGFEAFVQDIADLVKDSAGCGVVLLGRTQISETVYLILDAAGIEVCTYTIEPFTEAQGRDYVNRRARLLSLQSGVHGSEIPMVVHPDKYQKVRDLILGKLGEALSQCGSKSSASQEAKCFMGYAPVLDAVATLLSRATNFQTLENEINDLGYEGDNAEAPLCILENVVEQIIEREREYKLKKNLQPMLSVLGADSGWADWDLLYQQKEQVARLLGRVLSTRPEIERVVPEPMQSAYEKGVESFLPDHPFLRDGRSPVNAVFESYLFARGILENSGGLK